VLAQQDVSWTAEVRNQFFVHRGKSARPATEAVEAAQGEAAPSARVYSIEATSRQIDSLLAELKKNTSDVKHVVDHRSERDKDGVPPADVKRAYRILIQALPVSVPAAAPADADKN